MFLGRPRRFGRSLSLDVIFFKKLWCFPNLYVSLQKIKEHCKVLENQISKDRHIQYAFRILHIDNIPHVLKYGLVHKESSCANPKYVPIGDTTVMDARTSKQLPFGTFLSEYIPFYFGPRSPMLYNIQNGNGVLAKQQPEDIVYCVIRIEDVLCSDLNVIFTDGHALNNMSKFYEKSDLSRLDELVLKEDVYATFWFNQNPWDDRKR